MGPTKPTHGHTHSVAAIKDKKFDGQERTLSNK